MVFLQATGHLITTYYVRRTTYPQGGKWVRPYDEMNHKLRATSHMLLFRHLTTEAA